MGHKILKLSSLYPSYLEQIEAEWGDELSYSEAQQKLFYDSFSWGDFYLEALRKLGHQIDDIVFNAPSLQRRWARENGTAATGSDLILEQVKKYRPEIVFLDGLELSTDLVKTFRREVPSIRAVGIFNCSPASLRSLQLFQACDFVVTCHRGLCEDYNRRGLRAFHIFHGFGRQILDRVGPLKKPPSQNVLFSGSLVPGSDFHDLRLEILEGLVRNKIPLKTFALTDPTSLLEYLAKVTAFKTVQALSHWESNPFQGLDLYKRVRHWKRPMRHRLSSALKQTIQPPLFGLKMYRALAENLVAFNVHGGVAGQYASNMRLFEATGMGSCLLTDDKSDLGNLFDRDTQIVTYRSTEECLEKAKWLLQNPERAQEIGLAGQARTLKDHTYEQRAHELVDVFGQCT